MFRSPMSPASVFTSAASSARNATSASFSVAALTVLRPGILIPKNQTTKKITSNASATRARRPRTRRRERERIIIQQDSQRRSTAEFDFTRYSGINGDPMFQSAWKTNARAAEYFHANECADRRQGFDRRLHHYRR